MIRPGHIDSKLEDHSFVRLRQIYSPEFRCSEPMRKCNFDPTDNERSRADNPASLKDSSLPGCIQSTDFQRNRSNNVHNDLLRCLTDKKCKLAAASSSTDMSANTFLNKIKQTLI